MDILKKAVLYWQKQDLLIKKNADEVERSNGKLAFALLVMGCIAFIPFLVIAFAIDSYKDLSIPYVVMFCVLLVLLLLFQTLRKHLSSAFIVYMGYGFLVAYSIYTSAFVTPNSISVIILFFLFQIPIIVIDNSRRVNLIVILYAAIYMIVAIPFKNNVLLADEILNCLLFTVFGIGLGEILRAARLENFELKRLSLLRERIDDLTGLYNRKSLFEYLYNINTEDKSTQSIGVLMIDVDHFKFYNDTHGHQAGDECLRAIGCRFLAFGAENNMEFFRYGGEEFVGVSTAHAPEDLPGIGEKLNRAVFDMKIPHSAANGSFLTISVGVAVTTDLTAASFEKRLLSQADIALYAAKTRGRNRTVQFEPGMTMAGASPHQK